MKIAVVSLVVLGLVAAGAAAFVVRVWSLNPTMTPEAQTVDIVVAKAHLPAMTVVAAEDVAMESVPRISLPVGCLLSPIEAVGKSLNTTIMKGQAITRSCLAAPGSPADSIARIPEGKRVVTIPVSARSISGGFLHPGCIVDVMVTYEQSRSSRDESMSHLLLQRTTVWGVDDRTIASIQTQDDEKKPAPNTGGSSGVYKVSLLVDTKQAETVQTAASRGVITLAVRNPRDEAIEEETPAPAVDQNEATPPEAGVETPTGQQERTPEPVAQKRVEIIRGNVITDRSFIRGQGRGGINEPNGVQTTESDMQSK